MSFGKARAGRSWVRACMGRNSRVNAAGILGADISVPPRRGRPTPFCSVAFPEAMRHGLMASGICHLMQTTFHQGDPHPAAGAARLITPGASPAGARWGDCTPSSSSSSSCAPMQAQVGACCRARALMRPDRGQMAGAIRLETSSPSPGGKPLKTRPCASGGAGTVPPGLGDTVPPARSPAPSDHALGSRFCPVVGFYFGSFSSYTALCLAAVSSFPPPPAGSSPPLCFPLLPHRFRAGTAHSKALFQFPFPLPWDRRRHRELPMNLQEQWQTLPLPLPLPLHWGWLTVPTRHVPPQPGQKDPVIAGNKSGQYLKIKVLAGA